MTEERSPARKPRLRIRAGAAAQMGSRPAAQSLSRAAIERLFSPATPLPGVLPEGIAAASPLPKLAMDQAVTQFESAGALYGSSWATGMVWPGYQLLSEMAQRPEYRQMTETVAKSLTRKWIRLKSTDSKNDTARTDRIKATEKQLARHHIQDKFRQLAEHDGFFGRGHLYIRLKNADVDPEEIKTPLYMSNAKVGKGMLDYFKVVEPVWTYPANYNTIDPLAREFYSPTSWWVMGKEVHSSRLLTLISRAVPDMLKPAYSFGGLSMTQMAMPYVDNWLRTRQSVSDLIHAFSIMVLKTDMSAVLQGDEEGSGVEDIRERAAFFNATRDNRGLMIVDKEIEDFANVAAPISGLEKLQAQSQEQMAAVSHIPLVVLLGITPAGLNASTEGELVAYDQWVRSLQEHLFLAPLTTVIQVIQLSEFGDIDPGIAIEFVPLREQSEQEIAATKKIEADTDAVYIQNGVLDPAEVRQKVAEDEQLPYSGIDPDELPEPDMTEELSVPGIDPFGRAVPLAPGAEEPAKQPARGQIRDDGSVRI